MDPKVKFLIKSILMIILYGAACIIMFVEPAFSFLFLFFWFVNWGWKKIKDKPFITVKIHRHK